MNIQNKFLSIFLILTLLMNSFFISVSNADNQINREFLQSRIELMNYSNRDYLFNLNNQLLGLKSRIETYSTNKQKTILNNLDNRLNIALQGNLSKKNRLTINYIKNYFIYNFKQLDNQIDIDFDINEVKKVEQEILNLQKNIFNNGLDFYESIMSELDDLLNVKQKGNLSIETNGNIEGMASFDGQISLSNFETINSGIDSKISGNLDAKMNYENILNENENISGMLKTYFDFISKNEELYILLKDFGIDIESNDEEVSLIIEDIKKIVTELFENNRYAKIIDENSKEFIELLNTFTPEIVINKTKKTLEKPFLEVKRKVGNKYILKPTRHACEKYFELESNLQRINPFYRPTTCTDLAFNRFQKNFNDAGEFYLIIGANENILGFELNDKYNEFEKGFIELTYNNETINSFVVNMVPSGKEYEGQGLWFDYSKNNKLDFKLFVDENNSLIDIEFDSVLDYSNKINKANLALNIDNNFNGNLQYENSLLNGGFELNSDFINGNLLINNNILDGNFVIETYGYDYTTWEYGKTGEINLLINGNADRNLKMENLGINIIGKNTNDEEYLSIDSKIDFIGDRIIFNNDFNFTNPFIGSYNGKVNLEYESNREKEVLNIDVGINGNFGNINLNLISDFDREYGDFEINTPNNYIEINEEYMEDLFMSTNTYSSQIKRARDASRMTDLMSLRSGIEQVYQEKGFYPDYDEFKERLSRYIYSLPQDQLDGEVINQCEFGYRYYVGPDDNGIRNQRFKLSTCFEDDGNIETRAKTDGGIDDKRYEIGTGIGNDLGEGKFLRDLNKTIKENETVNINISKEKYSGNSIKSIIGGKTYEYTIKLMPDGNIWTTQNMRHNLSADGSKINRYCYDDDESNCDLFGGLYTWDSAMGGGDSDNENTSKSVCSALGKGWKLPTDNDWTTLIDLTGGIKRAGWEGTKIGGLISSLPGVRHSIDGKYFLINDEGIWWTSTIERLDEYYNVSRKLNSKNMRVITPLRKGDSVSSVVCIKKM